MKIKKYPQSHLVITNDAGKKLMIDPGYLTFQQFRVEDFQGADVYLITHQHSDHLDPNTIKEVVQENPVYGNKDVVAKLSEIGVKANMAENGKKFEVAGFEITPLDLPHFPHPLGNPMPQNTGFIVNGIFFHAGDGFELEGIQVENAALPIGHPSISTLQILNFAKSLQVKVIIPIHYDAYLRDPNELGKLAKQLNIEVRPLNNGEETTI